MPRTSPIGVDGVSRSWIVSAEGKVAAVRMRVRDRLGKYESETFPIKSYQRDGTPNLPLEAITWAKNTRSRYLAGTATAGTASTLDIGLEYVQRLKDTGAAKSYYSSIEHEVKAVHGAGMTDLKAEDFGSRFHHWLAGLRMNWWEGAEDFKFRRRKKALMELSNTTRNKLIRQMRSVVRYALAARKIDRDPLLGVARFKQESKLKALFTVDEMREMVSDEHRLNDAGEPELWWLPTCVLVYSGMRVQEALHLRWEWIDWHARTISLKVRPEFKVKGSKERLIPLQPELYDILKPLKKDEGWVIEDEGMRASGSALRERERTKPSNGDHSRGFVRYLERIGLTPGERTAHSTRHGYITLMLAMNVNFDRVMRSVGHVDATTTLGYSKQTPQYERAVKGWKAGEFRLRDGAKAKAEAK